MTLYRDQRDCPKCGAHRGFACHTFDTMPGCPQLQAAPEAIADDTASWWTRLLSPPPDDPAP